MEPDSPRLDSLRDSVHLLKLLADLMAPERTLESVDREALALVLQTLSRDIEGTLDIWTRRRQPGGLS